MGKIPALASTQIDELRRLDSATVSNAVESFGVRLPNTGFTDSTIHCLFRDFPPMVGYAVTARIRTANPPMEGHTYIDRTDWLDHILSSPEPRVVVLEDMDGPHRRGAFIGEMHANILRTLSCVGVVTNGAVRGIPTSRAIGLQMFAGNLCVSHAYAHVIDFGGAVTVGRMEVQAGELLHGDLHGVQTIPFEIAGRIPDAASRIVQYKQRIADLCRSGTFTLDRFRSAAKGLKHVFAPSLFVGSMLGGSFAGIFHRPQRAWCLSGWRRFLPEQHGYRLPRC
jgi:4-hydroxy-4-methyl-2-oxoglutarate aldolase